MKSRSSLVSSLANMELLLGVGLILAIILTFKHTVSWILVLRITNLPQELLNDEYLMNELLLPKLPGDVGLIQTKPNP